MSFWDMLRTPDVNAGAEEFEKTPGAVLLDVRTREEYRDGHIPGSVNLPVDEISRAPQAVTEKSTPIFTYCLSGARSRAAASALKELGYTNVKNIGGIGSYTGKRVRE